MKQLHLQRGFTLVELMIGTTLGLIVTTVALGGLAAHLRESRAIATEARLMQDLRAAADAITRNARRTGAWADAASRVGSGMPNPHDAWQTDASLLRVSYQRDASDTQRHGYRLRQGVVEVQMGDAGWQALTDDSSVVVTALRLEPRTIETSLASWCIRACEANGSVPCPPRLQQRQLSLHIEAHARHDPALRRQLSSTVNLRNDRVVGACAE
jgi:prepilin-type N-terminal cleavage/methylation domain-containing protein